MCSVLKMAEAASEVFSFDVCLAPSVEKRRNLRPKSLVCSDVEMSCVRNCGRVTYEAAGDAAG